MKKRYKILVTNDDGYEAKGLLELVKTLRNIDGVDVTVVAPANEKSACGHSLTLIRPLRFISVEDDFYKLDDGTPSDCIYLSLSTMFEKEKPNLIISGINRGSNMGEDITYSGTVAGASEAVLQGVPAISISQVFNNLNKTNKDLWNYELASKTIFEMVKKILGGSFPLKERKLLNINIPPIHPSESNGIKITKAGHRLYGSNASVHTNPRGIEYHWLGLHPLRWNSTSTDEIMCDFDAVDKNYVSITPIKLDMTAYDEIKELEVYFE